MKTTFSKILTALSISSLRLSAQVYAETTAMDVVPTVVAATMPISIPLILMGTVATVPFEAVHRLGDITHTFQVYEIMRKKLNDANSVVQVDPSQLPGVDLDHVRKLNVQLALVTEVFKAETQFDLIEVHRECRFLGVTEEEFASFTQYRKDYCNQTVNNWKQKVPALQNLNRLELNHIIQLTKNVVAFETEKMAKSWRQENSAILN